MGQNQIHFLFLSFLQENGYQLIFLSARAISQASVTRQFLVNLKQVIRHNAFQLFRNQKSTVLLLILVSKYQDGKALPDGPVVISPDGLFPSLFREGNVFPLQHIIQIS